MGKRGKFPQARPKKEQLEAMARMQTNSFEPDLLGEIKYRNAEDPYAEDNVEPLTAAELREQDQIIENQRRLLGKALQPGGNDAQLAPFTGSIVDKVLQIAREAVALGAPTMTHADWMAEVHEVLYDRHLPFSAQTYQIFRIAARGDLRDPEVVRFLILQRMIEKRKISKETSDKLGGAHTAIKHMYGAMKRDVESARRRDEESKEKGNVCEANSANEQITTDTNTTTTTATTTTSQNIQSSAD